MKISSRQYALSLYESVKDKSDMHIKQTIKEFAAILFKNRDIKIADDIIKNFIKICDDKDGLVNARVVVAEKLDTAMAGLLENYIVKIAQAKKVNIIEEIDKSILGGVVINYGDNVLDGSLRTKLNELKKTMIK